MADINRKTVDYLVLHHSVTPLWSNKSKKELAQWFSDNGFKRGYESNPARWSGLINPYTGAKSYSQAHYAGQRVDKTTPDATDKERQAGFRLVPLVKDVWGQICWHAGNWEINRASIGIECVGDYRNYTLRDGDCRVIADFWRPQDIKLGGKTAVLGHGEIAATACPARIMEKRNTIVNYINNPPKPLPVVTVKEETRTEKIHFTKTEVKNSELEIGKVNIIQKGQDGVVTVTETVTYTDGKETSRVTKSRVITKQPVEEVTEIGTKTKDQEQDERLTAIEQFLSVLKGLWNIIHDYFVGKGKQ